MPTMLVEIAASRWPPASADSLSVGFASTWLLLVGRAREPRPSAFVVCAPRANLRDRGPWDLSVLNASAASPDGQGSEGGKKSNSWNETEQMSRRCDILPLESV